MICELFLTNKHLLRVCSAEAKCMIEDIIFIIKSFRVSLNENHAYENNGQQENTCNKCLLYDTDILGEQKYE